MAVTLAKRAADNFQRDARAERTLYIEHLRKNVAGNGNPQVGHHRFCAIEWAVPAKIVTVLFCRTLWLSFLRSQLNDVMNFIPPFARRLVPGQNYPDHAIFDLDHITDFELRFVRSASKSLALWFILHPSILPQHE